MTPYTTEGGRKDFDTRLRPGQQDSEEVNPITLEKVIL